MRLLGLALFTLLVMGLIQFALWADSDTTSRVVGRLAEAERVVHDFASDVTAEERGERLGDLSHTFVVREADTFGALAGSPGYHRARFNLPRDVRVEEGTLILDLSAQLQDEGIARLKINVNGQRRGELVLPEGKSEHRVQLNLLPTDLTSSVLEVNLAADGRFPQAACTGHWNGGMVVRVEPTSRVELETSEPLRSLEDRLRATGDPAQIMWSERMDPMSMARLVRFAAHQHVQGARTTFLSADDTERVGVLMSTQDMDRADEIVAETSAGVAATWPMRIAEDTQLGAAKFFEFRTDWRIPYDLRSTPGAELPTHFDFDMSLIGLNEAERWMVSAVLNGRAIYTERLTDGAERITRSVPLPPELQGFSNVLELRLINAEPRSGIDCLSGVPVMAQLEAGTQLRGGAAPADTEVASFINALPDDLHLNMASAFNAAEATASVQFLMEAFGASKQWHPSETFAQSEQGAVQLLWRSDVAQAVAQAQAAHDRALWMLWPRLATEQHAPYGLVRVTPETDLSTFLREDGARIAALVSLPQPPVALAATNTDALDVAPQSPGRAVTSPAPALGAQGSVAPARAVQPAPFDASSAPDALPSIAPTADRSPLAIAQSARPAERPTTWQAPQRIDQSRAPAPLEPRPRVLETVLAELQERVTAEPQYDLARELRRVMILSSQIGR